MYASLVCMILHHKMSLWMFCIHST